MIAITKAKNNLLQREKNCNKRKKNLVRWSKMQELFYS